VVCANALGGITYGNFPTLIELRVLVSTSMLNSILVVKFDENTGGRPFR
jgi:hypothetical protein